MRATRFLMTGLAAAALVLAAGCKTASTTSTSTTETTPAMASSTTTTDNGNGTSTTTVTTPAASATTNTTNTTNTTLTTSTDNSGTVTQTLPNGTTVTRSQTTTIVLPNGQVQTVNGTPSSSSMASSSTTTTESTSTNPANLPPGSVVTKTTTTIKTTNTAAPAVVAATSNQQPPVVYVNNPPPMTSSTTIYQPYTPMRGRRFPGTNFLVFANRASFSNSNSALSGTLNTGNLRSDIDRENGYGLGFNTYLGHSNFSTEFTASYIRPRLTLTPANTSFNPITNYRFRMIPVTGTLQLHMNPRSSVDFYVGGGGAWVHFTPYNSAYANQQGFTGLHFRNEWGPLVNAGLGFSFSPNFGVNFDAKYMWVRAKATATYNNVTIGNVGNSEHIGVNPFIISAGLRFGF